MLNDHTFTPAPERPEALPPRLTGAFCGVPIPDDIIVFDCRIGEEFPLAQVAAPWGELIYSRGGYALGLVRGWTGDVRYPRGIEARHIDNRNPHNCGEVAGMFTRVLAHYREVLRAFVAAEGQFKPLAIEIGNYGMTVIANGREYR